MDEWKNLEVLETRPRVMVDAIVRVLLKVFHFQLVIRHTVLHMYATFRKHYKNPMKLD